MSTRDWVFLRKEDNFDTIELLIDTLVRINSKVDYLAV